MMENESKFKKTKFRTKIIRVHFSFDFGAQEGSLWGLSLGHEGPIAPVWANGPLLPWFGGTSMTTNTWGSDFRLRACGFQTHMSCSHLRIPIAPREGDRSWSFLKGPIGPHSGRAAAPPTHPLALYMPKCQCLFLIFPHFWGDDGSHHPPLL